MNTSSMKLDTPLSANRRVCTLWTPLLTTASVATSDSSRSTSSTSAFIRSGWVDSCSR